MLVNSVLWLVCVVISVIAQKAGLVESGAKVFFYIYMGAQIVRLFGAQIFLCYEKMRNNDMYITEKVTVAKYTFIITAIVFVVVYGIFCAVAWIIARLAQVDFFATYMILSFGTTFFGNSSERKLKKS